MNIGENNIIGTCLTMCPDKEADIHRMDENSAFEYDPNTNKFSKDYAITTFHRSAANQKYKASEIRPLPVLQKTMDHILNFVIGKRLNTSDKTTEIDLYMYLRGRFRAICTDITVQHLEGKEIIDLYQKMILFFIWAGVRFGNMANIDAFDKKLNRDIATNIFTSLDDQYLFFFKKTEVHHPFEADFRAFHLLLYLSDEQGHQFMPKLKLIPDDIIETTPIKNVLKLRQALISRNIPEFLRVIDSTPIQFSAMALQNAPNMYYDTFLAMRKSLRTFKIDKEFFTTYLDLPNGYFLNFTKCFLINKDTKSTDNDYWSFVLNANPQEELAPKLPLPLDFDQRFKQSPLYDFFILKPSQPSYMDFDKVKPDKIVNQPVIEDKPYDEQIESPEMPNQPSDTNLKESESPYASDHHSDSFLNEPEPLNASPQSPSTSSNKQRSPEASDDQSHDSFIISEQPEPILNKPESLIISPQPESILNKPKSPIISPQSSRFLLTTSNIIENPHADEITKLPDNQQCSPTSLVNDEISITMIKKIVKRKLFDFKSMIPSSLPPYCFISIVVNDSDGSPSAEFARDCFSKIKTSNNPMNKKNYVLYLDDFKIQSLSPQCRKSHVYVAIVRKQLQKYMNSIGAILNCEDTTIYDDDDEEIDNDTKIFTFSLSDSKSSPELVLNSLMRKCIESAVVEFESLNLTDLVESALALSLNIILSPEWIRASCNSVLTLFNDVVDALANIFESELFMRYLLPFIHDKFGPKDMKDYASSIRKMKVSLIVKEESIKPRLDSTWPIFIRDNMKITSVTPFIAPVSTKFNRQEFLTMVVGPFEDFLPFEYVSAPEEDETSYTDILHAFDCDLYE